MPNPVTTTDLENGWRPLSSQETINAQTFLDDAWAELVVRVPDLDSRIDDGSLTAATVVRVVRAMVLRVLRNPDGKVQENIDDYGYRRSDAVADGLLYATDDELALLRPNLGTGGAFSITPHSTPDDWTSCLGWS